MIIQDLDIHHAAACVKIWQAAHYGGVPFGGVWHNKQIISELYHHKGRGVFTDTCDMVGFGLYRVIPQGVEITCLATSRTHQRKGVMSLLLTSLINNLGLHQILWLEVHEKNSPALNLYKNLGINIVGCRKNYYRDGGAALLFEYKPLQ